MYQVNTVRYIAVAILTVVVAMTLREFILRKVYFVPIIFCLTLYVEHGPSKLWFCRCCLKFVGRTY